MKLTVLLGLAFIGLSSFSSQHLKKSNYTIVQTSDKSGELVIGIPDFNSKRFDEVMTLINGVDGVSKVNYCENLKVFLIQYDQNKIHSSEDLFAMLEKTLHDFQIYHKIGKSIDELKTSC